MDNQNYLTINNKVVSNYNDILFNIINKIQNVIDDIDNNKKVDIIIKQLKNIIILMNETIKQNLKNNEDIKKINENINNRFQNLENIIFNNNKNKNKSKKNNNGINTKIYDFGKYVGQLKNDKRHGEGIQYYNDGTKFEGFFRDDKAEKGIMYYGNGERYEGEIKNAYRHEKEFIILIMEIDMKVILIIIIGKEKEYIIMKMVIDMKGTLKMIK